MSIRDDLGVGQFSRTALLYCGAIESVTQDSHSWAHRMVRILVDLLKAGYALPHVTDIEIEEEVAPPIGHPTDERLAARLRDALGKNDIYWTCIDDDVPVAGTVAERLLELYSWMKPLLNMWSSGPSERDAAIVFHWSHAFRSWQYRGLLDALRVLHRIAYERLWDDEDRSAEGAH